MASAQKPKASDKQAVAKKLVASLKKRYKGSPPPDDLPVLETVLYAVCLEDVSVPEAEAAYERLQEKFFDLNEIRVSSISELVTVFEGLPNPQRRAQMTRNTLQHVFERQYDFDMEALRRKTLDQATRQLEQIRDLSAFARNYVLQTALGSHLVPADTMMTRAAFWLGLIDPGLSNEEASEALKPVIRKADAAQFCYLLRCLATDPELQSQFDPAVIPPPEDGYDLNTAANRLKKLIDSGPDTPAETGGAAETNSTRKTSKKSGSSTKKSAAKSGGNRDTKSRNKSSSTS